MTAVRAPAVAGLFYPADPRELEATVRGLLAGADRAAPARAAPAPKALIVPHAGYAYSGRVAAAGYRLLRPLCGTIRRVVLIGPAHRDGEPAIMTHDAALFETPLGRIAVDPLARALPHVIVKSRAHAQEHSLEVHLPFLQVVLGEFSLVPLLVGRVPATQVAETLESAWGGPETVVIVSSDLSHYHPYDEACELDRATAATIVARLAEGVVPSRACGAFSVAGLLEFARRHDLDVSLVELCNSGDTAGTHDQVVGYGAFAVA